MTKSPEEILALYQTRKNRLDPLHQAALVVRQAYYGEITLAVPEMDRNEAPLVANLLYQGGEQRAMRVASTMPTVQYPSRQPGQDLADNRANDRRLVNLNWWDEDRMRIKMRKRARHMVFYAMTPILMRPNFQDQRPTWQVRNPLHTFPPELDVAEICPPDCIFTLFKSGAWLQQCYPDQYHKLNKLNSAKDGDSKYTILEYVDSDELVTCAIGGTHKPSTNFMDNVITSRVGEIQELERIPNRTGRPLASVPGRIGLEEARGEFDGVIGLWQAQARLMALLTIGTQKAIYPETWLVSHPNQEANIVTVADPMHGVIGEIEGGTIMPIHMQPEALASNLIDRLERGFRIEAGVPAELGGESTSNIRTGRRGDAVLSAVLDFPIQEEQQLLEVALREENRMAIAIDKAYFPGTKSVFFSATSGEITYEPEKLWTTDNNFVRYARAGVDAQGLTVEIGQRVGMGVLSKESAMEIDPLVEDPRAEMDRMMLEQTRAGLQASIAQMSADPTMAPVVAKIVKELAGKHIEIEDAVIAIDTAIKAEQQAQAEAAAQQQAQMGAGPGAEAQPGMAEPIPTIPESAGGLQNLTALMSQLHRTQTAGTLPAPQLQQTG